MSSYKNPVHIIEAAKNILHRHSSNENTFGIERAHSNSLTALNNYSVSNVNDSPHKSPNREQITSLLNKEIIKIKEMLQSEKFTKSSTKIEDLIVNCISIKILPIENAKRASNLGELLDELLLLRKKSKSEIIRQWPNNFSNVPPSHDLLMSSRRYTVSSLSHEFSCMPEKIDRDFVKEKLEFCCSKLHQLVSQYENYLTHNAPVKRHCIQSGIIGEIDCICNKIDLAENFLRTIDKSRSMSFSI